MLDRISKKIPPARYFFVSRLWIPKKARSCTDSGGGGSFDKENISEGFESTLMQNRGNLTPSPRGLYSSFSSTSMPAETLLRKRDREGMRFLPQDPLWPSFTGQWMEKSVPRKHGLACKEQAGRVTKRGRRMHLAGRNRGRALCQRPIRQLADPFKPLLPSLP